MLGYWILEDGTHLNILKIRLEEGTTLFSVQRGDGLPFERAVEQDEGGIDCIFAYGEPLYIDEIIKTT